MAKTKKEKTKPSSDGSKAKRLVLLDAHAIIHRAYHALPDFTSDEGEPTGALYGLSAMLMKLVQELHPDYLIAAYDLPGPTKRHEIFDEYKAGRQELDVNLTQQLERSKDIFKAFSIPIFSKEGFEADDIIGTIVEKLKKFDDVEIIIATGDHDTLQLVEGKRVRVYTLRKGLSDTVEYDERMVKERYGFLPKLLPDYKGLRGDPSDNIPGIKGIGEKTAGELVKAFGSLDNIYSTLEKNQDAFLEKGFKKRVIELLASGRDEAEFSKMLAEIRRDAPISFSVPKLPWRDALRMTDVLKLFRELSFRTLTERAKRLFGTGDGPRETPVDTEVVSEKDVEKTALALSLLDSNISNPAREDIFRFAKTASFKKAKEYIFGELKKQKLEKVYLDIELPLVPVVKKMEARGVKIDTKYLKTLSRSYHHKLQKIEKNIHKLAGGEFNINSPRQLGEILYDRLELVSKGKTAKGQRSTRESELEKILDTHPIIEEILKHRELQKLLSTYIDNLPHMVSPEDGRLHARWIQIGAATGRMASQSPNLQNIPIRTELGRVVRNAFVAADGFVLAALDYSQIELRVAAIFSGDPRMKKIFTEKGDIHAAVAEEVFGEATPEARRLAKVINFGIIYGMGSTALSRTASISRTEADAFLKRYFEKFSTLKEFIENTKLDARRKGHTETLFGRRRFFPGLSSHLPYVRAEAERQAQNAPLQGTSADIIKIAMRDAEAWILQNTNPDDVHLVLQVHDELIYEVNEKKVQDVVPNLKRIMEEALPKNLSKGIPLLVSASVGKNWGETEPLVTND